MAISRTPVVSNLGSFVVIDTDADENAQTNTTGSAGKMHMLQIDNTNNSGVVYVKFYDTAGSITVATANPNYQFRADGSTLHTLVFPEGLTFAVGFTHVCVTNVAPGDTGPGSAVTIRYITT